MRIERIKFFIKRVLWRKRISSSSIISSSARIGKNCRIKSKSIIGSEVVLDNDVVIGSEVVLEKITIGECSRIDSRVICTGSLKGKIVIGRNSYIGLNNILDHSDNITIGDFVHIAGPSTGLWTHTSYSMCLNSIKLKDTINHHRPTKPITIDDNVYIGGNCSIYPGITIGHHSIIAPNSAVVKDVPPYSMVGGVPAKFIKHTYDMIDGFSGQKELER